MKYSRIINAEDNKCQPVFWQTQCCTFALPLSVSRDLHFNCVHLKTVTQAEQECKLFGRLASVLWVLCACQCACLVALAIRDFAYCVQGCYSLSIISFTLFSNTFLSGKYN